MVSCVDEPRPRGWSGTRAAQTSSPGPSQPAATAAASMFATGATSCAHTTVADTTGYSSSRRANNSRLIAEISPSSCRTDPLTVTFSATTSASVAGT